MSQGDEAWRRTFEELQEYRGPVEITPLSHRSDDQLAPTFRARLLTFDEEGFVIERPEDLEANRYLTVGTQVKLVGASRRDRWECFSAISGFFDFHAPGHGEVLAIQLSWPHEVRSAQRRREPRHSVEGIRIEPVVLFPIAPIPRPVLEPGQQRDPNVTSEQAVQPMSPPSNPFEATLLNLGTGGIGVQAIPNPGTPLHFTQYRVVITLPSQPEALVLKARVAHRQPQVHGQQYLGMAFVFETATQQQNTGEAVARFVEYAQRLRSGEPSPRDASASGEDSAEGETED